MRLNFDASSVLHRSSARSKTRSSRRISFPRFSTPSFPFCSIPKTENSELKTSEFYRTTIFFTKLCNFTHFDQTPRFRFCAIPQTENSEMKTPEFDPIIAVLSAVQNGKLGVGKPRSLIKVPLQFDQNTSEKISDVFISEFSVLAMVQNGNLGGENLGKYSLRFPRFLRTPSFRPHHPSSVFSGSSFLSFSACLIAKFGSWLMNDLFYIFYSGSW